MNRLYMFSLLMSCLYIFNFSVKAQSLRISDGFMVVDSGTFIVIPEDLISDSAEVQLSGSIDVKGSILLGDSANFDYGTESDIILSSGTNQTIFGVDTVRSLTISNNTDANLSSDLVLSDSLKLDSGRVVLGNFNLTLASGTMITGASDISFIETNGTGGIEQEVGATPMLFPVGNNGSYLPLTVTNSGTTDNISVTASDNFLADGSSGSVVTERVVGKTWVITEETPGGSNLSLSFQWSGSDELTNFDRNNVQIFHYVGGEWTEEGSQGMASGSDPYTYTVGGITTLSPFGVGDGGSVFPVEWLNFSATIKFSSVELQWATASESQSDFFGIERSIDADNWEEIGQVNAAGNSNIIREYVFQDEHPRPDHNYYRLRQVDINGEFQYSQTIEVRLLRSKVVSIFPNPAEDEITVNWDRNIPINIIVLTMEGKVVKQVFSEEKFPVLSLRGLSSGVYIMELYSASELVQKVKLIKR